MLTYEYYRNNIDQFKKYHGKDLIPLNCANCTKLYYNEQRKVRNRVYNYGNRKTNLCFCSKECSGEYTSKSITKPCGFCDRLVTRSLAEYKKSKSKKIFCNHSCSVSYGNKHKKHGVRRSKLELFLEEQLKIIFPNFIIFTNNRDTINLELDFYFPQLKFAIELNGPTHYEPIYGQNKFEKVKNNDKQKLIRCYEQGIELMIIDVSKVTYINECRKKYYLNLIVDQINIIKNRAECFSPDPGLEPGT